MSNSKKIFITGGAGYCGSRLVPFLLEKGHIIKVYDIMHYGSDHLPRNNENLEIIKGDIRDSDLIYKESKGYDIFVNLACISNDASFVLDEKLSSTVNMEAFEPMVIAAKKAGIKRFIYASTSSVYGVSKEKNVTETHPLVPLTLYNKFKGDCEPLLFKHTDEKFIGVAFRPATVCGYAPRLRLDLSVNILTNHAVNNRKILVFGGDQLRPNLYIQDYCEAVNTFIEAEENKIQNEIFNVGYQNLSIKQIAELVKKVVEEKTPQEKPIEIEYQKSDDNRSYHINSDKIKKVLNFAPQFSIEYAISELCEAFNNKLIPDSFDNDIYYNVRTLKKINAK
ncbi:NAD-dependent epimerase/dehydratase family protein [Candidatus Pelagibacter sp.]|uniref:NAD-dependent epimerase/dehydratase family protein n=1 Tax=Candidatus Pelagibacter sp. TaxID=2024849 RepID=UPI003D0CD1F9